MAWTKPGYSKGEVDHAGRVLVGNIPDEFVLDDDTWDEAFTVINNWRASHGYPLLAMRMAFVVARRELTSGRSSLSDSSA